MDSTEIVPSLFSFIIFLCLIGMSVHASVKVSDSYKIEEACEDKGYVFIKENGNSKCYDEYKGKYYPLKIEDGFFGIKKIKVLDGEK